MAAEFRSRRGRIRPLAVVFVSLLAVVSIAISGMPATVKAVLALAVALAAYHSLARAPTHTIKLDPSASPSLDGARGSLTGEAVTGMFVALKLETPDGLTRRAFLFRDELDTDSFRALLAYLHHGLG